MPIGTIPIDSIFSPVQQGELHRHARARRPRDRLRPARARGLDRRHASRPVDAVAFAAKILKEQLAIFINFEEPTESPLPTIGGVASRSTRTCSARSTSSSCRCARRTACRTPNIRLHRRAGAAQRGRDAQDQELRPQVAERDQGDARESWASRSACGSRASRRARSSSALAGARGLSPCAIATSARASSARTAAHRRAMFRNLVTSLLEHEQIETTDAKAKELRRAGRAHDHARQARRRCTRGAARCAVIRERDVAAKLFDELAERYRGPPGRLHARAEARAARVGDAAPMSIVTLVEPAAAPAKPARRRPDEGRGARRRRGEEGRGEEGGEGREAGQEEGGGKKAAAKKRSRKKKSCRQGGLALVRAGAWLLAAVVAAAVGFALWTRSSAPDPVGRGSARPRFALPRARRRRRGVARVAARPGGAAELLGHLVRALRATRCPRCSGSTAALAPRASSSSRSRSTTTRAEVAAFRERLGLTLPDPAATPTSASSTRYQTLSLPGDAA